MHVKGTPIDSQLRVQTITLPLDQKKKKSLYQLNPLELN